MIKQLHFKSWLLLLLCMIVGVGSASAQDVKTFILSGTNAQVIESVSEGPVTITFSKGTGNNAPAWYDSGQALRFYSGNSIQISSSGAKISKVELTNTQSQLVGGDSGANFPSNGTYSVENKVETWVATTAVSSLDISITNKPRLTTIVVYLETSSASLDHITLSGADIDNVPAFYVNTPFTHDNVTVTAHYTDNSTQDVTSSATFTAPDMTTAAEGKTVTVSYTEGTGEQAITKTATYPINVYEITTHTLKWMVNGEVASYDDNFPSGQPITFPANPADIEGKTFVGWVENSIQGTTDTAPEFVTSAVMPNHNMTYYAVFATNESSSASLTKMTTGDTFAVGDNVVLVANGTTYGLYQETISSSYVKNFVFDNDVETIAADSKNYLTVSAGSDGKWILGDATNGYLYSSSSNNLSVVTTSSSQWTLIDNNDGTFGLTQGRYLSCRTDLTGDNQNKWRLAGTTPVGAYHLDIYKYINGSVSYSGYCTTVETDTRSEAGISFAESAVTAEYAVPYYGQTLNNPNNVAPITWTSNVPTIATVSDAGVVTVLGTGKVVITAKFDGDDNYKPAKVHYTLQVNDSRTNLTMTFDPESVSATVSETTITAPTLTVKDVNDNTVTGLPISYISNNDEVATVTDEGVVTLKGVAGNATITAQFAGNAQYFPADKDYTIIVTDPNGPGSENNPYTVAQARAAIDANSGVTDVYATGIVSEIVTPLNTQYGNITYNISADGTTTADQLQAYRGKGVNGANFTSEDDIQVGDVVVVKGNLKKYNSTYEFDQNNELVSLIRKPAPTIKLVDEDETEVEDELNVQFNGQKGLDVYCFANDVDITNDVEITWTSADETIATYDGFFVKGLAMGTTTITFNFAGNADYRPVSKVLTVNVEDARTPVTLTFGEVPSSINVGETASYPIEEGYSVTYTSSDDNIVSVDEDGEITANEVGTATITATYDGDEMFQPATASYTITVVDPSTPVHVTQWVEVDPATLTTGDVVVIVDKTSSKAMANDQGTSAAPTATVVTLNAAKTAITSEVDENIQWTVTVSGTNEKSYQFGVAGTDNYLYTTAANNGLRVGTNPDNVCGIYDNDGVNFITLVDSKEQTRYVGVYDDQDWRGYTSINTNIGNTVTAFYKKVEEDCIPVTITSAGAASFSSKYALDFSKVPEPTAYKATSKSDSYVHLDEVEQVPAGAGVIVKGAEGLYFVPVVTGDVAELEGNLLVGTGENTFTVTSAEYGKVFKYVKTNAGVVGFQKAKEGWTCQAGHAYLMLSEVQAREFIGIFDEDVVTGISGASLNDNGQMINDNDVPAYNLAGQKVGKGYKGIVIKNGKKVVVK